VGKKRFGIAIPTELVNELDTLVKDLNMNRSKLVEQAIKEFLCEFKHYLKPHECTGVMLIFDTASSRSSDIIDEFRDIILAYTHHHVGDRCIEIIVLKGSSETIAKLHKKLLGNNHRCRFIPFHLIGT
jgi:CopG family nickel-responsive transcriptional regulator